MPILQTILPVFVGMFAAAEYSCDGAVCVQVQPPAETQPAWISKKDMTTIKRAAQRNKIKIMDPESGRFSDLFLIMLAIRRAENGPPGLEFGIKHPKCAAQIAAEPHRSLDIQAGWAAATIINIYFEWAADQMPGEFIDFLGDRWCPKSVDPVGNVNWKKNVKSICRQNRK